MSICSVNIRATPLSVVIGYHNMTVTQGRLLPSIVRVNSESDIEEEENELTKLPALVNGNVEGEQQSKKWWMRDGKSRFFARPWPSKASWRQQKLHKRKTSNKWLPPLQGEAYIRVLQVIGFC